VFQKLEVRNVFFAVAFEVHLSEDAAQHIGISRQTMVEADALTTIHLTADALALPGSTRKGKIVREKVELGKKTKHLTHHERSAIVSVTPEGSAAICTVQ